MAGSVRKIMAYLGLVDDEYDDYEDLSERSRPPSTRSTRSDPRERYDDDDYDRDYREPVPTAGSRVSPIRTINRDGSPAGPPGRSQPVSTRPTVVPMSANDHAKVHVVRPVSFSEAKEIGDQIRQSNPVIVNLQGAGQDLPRRMIDFCSGVAYALGCGMERVADQVFLLTPNDVTVSAEERERLQRRGFNQDDD